MNLICALLVMSAPVACDEGIPEIVFELKNWKDPSLAKSIEKELSRIRGVDKVIIDARVKKVQLVMKEKSRLRLKDIREAIKRVDRSLLVDERGIRIHTYVIITLRGLGHRIAEAPNQLQRLKGVRRVNPTKMLYTFSLLGDPKRGVSLKELKEGLQSLVHHKLTRVGDVIADIEWFSGRDLKK